MLCGTRDVRSVNAPRVDAESANSPPEDARSAAGNAKSPYAASEPPFGSIAPNSVMATFSTAGQCSVMKRWIPA